MKNPWILLPEGTRGSRFQPASILRSRDAGSDLARGSFLLGHPQAFQKIPWGLCQLLASVVRLYLLATGGKIKGIFSTFTPLISQLVKKLPAIRVICWKIFHLTTMLGNLYD